MQVGYFEQVRLLVLALAKPTKQLSNLNEYVSSDGKLCYCVIDPYAVPGKERCYMGITYSGVLDENVGSISTNYVMFSHRGKYGVNINWTDNQGKSYRAVIDQWHGLTKKEFSPGVGIVLSVDSRNAEGVTFIAAESGSYTLTIVGGAFCYLPETDPNWSKYGGWLTKIHLYINKPVEWGARDEWGLHPVNFDKTLGSGGSRDERHYTFAEAEAAGRDLSLTVHLDKDDYIIALVSDGKDYYYTNTGTIQIRITSP